MTTDPFLSAVEAAIARSGMTDSKFGRKAVGDTNFVGDLRNGRECRRSIRDRVMKLVDAIMSAPPVVPNPEPDGESVAPLS